MPAAVVSVFSTFRRRSERQRANISFYMPRPHPERGEQRAGITAEFARVSQALGAGRTLLA
jgi:hypothetical protein